MKSSDLIKKSMASLKPSTPSPQPPVVEPAVQPEVVVQKTEPVSKVHRASILVGHSDLKSWARNEANEILKKEISDDTKEQYLKVAERLEKTRTQPGEPLNIDMYADKASTFYAYRAALRYNAAVQVKKAMNAVDKAHRNNDESAKNAAYQLVLQYAADLKKYSRDVQPGVVSPLEVKLGLSDPKAPGVPTQLAGQVSEREHRETAKLKDTNKIVRKYPDWRQRVWDRFKAIESPWIDQLAIVGLTGCRPDELGAIKIERVGGSLRITINGSKTDIQKGQPWRRFTFNNDGSVEFKHLYDRAPATLTAPSTPNAFSMALERAGKQVLPDAPRLCGYVYRHSISSDMKADKANKVQIAMVLGHSVTKTQSCYGRAVGGRAGVRPMQIESAREVRVNHDTRYTSGSPAPVEDAVYTSPTFGGFEP